MLRVICIFWIPVLGQIRLLKIFPPSLWLVFSEHKCLVLIKSNLSIFFMTVLSVLYSRSYQQTQAWVDYLLLFLGALQFFTFKYMAHFEVRQLYVQTRLVARRFPLAQHHPLEMLSFLCCVASAPLPRSVGSICARAFLYSLSCSVDLCGRFFTNLTPQHLLNKLYWGITDTQITTKYLQFCACSQLAYICETISTIEVINIHRLQVPLTLTPVCDRNTRHESHPVSTFLSAQHRVYRLHDAQEIFTTYSSCITAALYPLNTDSPFLPRATSGHHLSVRCF